MDRVKYGLVLLAGFLMTIPAFAGAIMHMDSTPFDTNHTVMIGQTPLDAGHYTIKGKESDTQIEIWQNDRVVATVPCQWVRLNEKASHNEVLSNNNQVTGVRFEGRSEAVKIG